jgi:tetratricopeptide (TPR) repeat protein
VSRSWLVGSLVLVAACGDNHPVDPAPDASPDSDRPPGVALCYSAAATAHPATAQLYAALADGAREARGAAIDALEQAVIDLPDEEQLHLLLGLAHLWRLAEPLPGEDDLAIQLPSALAARDRLTRAYELCPTDHRIAAWLGPILVQFGRSLNDPATIEEGLAVLDRGIAAYPSFVLFSRLLIHADAPRDAPEFRDALGAVVDNIDACRATPADPACTNATVPHNREGAAVFLGDVLTKAGRRGEALAAYRDALEGPDFATWSFQPLLRERIDQIDTRLALYADADPANDPDAAWRSDVQCALCHSR